MRFSNVRCQFVCSLVRMRRRMRTLVSFLVFFSIDIAIAIGEGREGKVF